MPDTSSGPPPATPPPNLPEPHEPNSDHNQTSFSDIPVYKRSLNCTICNSFHRGEIDAALLLKKEGMQKIANRFPPITKSSIQRHSAKCWPTIDVTRVPRIERPRELGQMADMLVTRKHARLQALQKAWDGIQQVIAERAAAYAHLPGGGSGLLAVKPASLGVGKGHTRKYELVQVLEFDAKLIEKMLEIHAAVARETGEALEQAGKVQTLVTGDNPCIMVLGAGAPKPADAVEARLRVTDTGRRQPLEVPDESVPRPVSASMMDIETILDARERALSGMDGGSPEVGGEGDDDADLAEVELEPATDDDSE